MARKRFQLRFTPEELLIIDAKAHAAGFTRKSEYIRFTLLLDMTLAEKIDKIYRVLHDRTP